MNDMENGGGRLGTLHGQRVIVMGGSSGIGLAVAHAALRAGADVTVVSSQLARIEKALEFLGSAAQGCAVDLASEAAIERYFRTSGRFDHLVYTAGDSLRLLPLAEADLSDVRSAFNLRYWGALAAAKHSASRLRDGGSITLTSGIARSEERRVGKECRSRCDWSSDVCSSDLAQRVQLALLGRAGGGQA